MRQQQTTAERSSSHQHRKADALTRVAITDWQAVVEDLLAMPDDPTTIHGKYWYRVQHCCGHMLKRNQWQWRGRHEERCGHIPCAVLRMSLHFSVRSVQSVQSEEKLDAADALDAILRTHS